MIKFEIWRKASLLETHDNPIVAAVALHRCKFEAKVLADLCDAPPDDFEMRSGEPSELNGMRKVSGKLDAKFRGELAKYQLAELEARKIREAWVRCQIGVSIGDSTAKQTVAVLRFVDDAEGMPCAAVAEWLQRCGIYTAYNRSKLGSRVLNAAKANSKIIVDKQPDGSAILFLKLERSDDV